MSNPKQCRHIRTSGQRCGSAALTQQTFCFYHQRTRNRPAASAEGVRPQDHTFEFEPTDDRSSIQFAVFEVLRRIALNQIDCKRAGHLLYGLQIAATVLPREPRPAAAPAPKPAPPAVEDYIIDPDLGPLAPEADYIPPTEPTLSNSHLNATSATSSSALSTEMNRVLSSFTQPTRPHIPLPDPTFYRDPASQGYPELQPFLNEARRAAGLAPINTHEPTTTSHSTPTTTSHSTPDASSHSAPNASSYSIPDASRYPKASALGLLPTPHDEEALASGVCLSNESAQKPTPPTPHKHKRTNNGSLPRHPARSVLQSC